MRTAFADTARSRLTNRGLVDGIEFTLVPPVVP